jgi:hypothetical protein
VPSFSQTIPQLDVLHRRPDIAFIKASIARKTSTDRPANPRTWKRLRIPVDEQNDEAGFILREKIELSRFIVIGPKDGGEIRLRWNAIVTWLIPSRGTVTSASTKRISPWAFRARSSGPRCPPVTDLST